MGLLEVVCLTGRNGIYALGLSKALNIKVEDDDLGEINEGGMNVGLN